MESKNSITNKRVETSSDQAAPAPPGSPETLRKLSLNAKRIPGLVVLFAVIISSCGIERKQSNRIGINELSPVKFLTIHGRRLSAKLEDLPQLNWEFNDAGSFLAHNEGPVTQVSRLRPATIRIEGNWQGTKKGYVILRGKIHRIGSGESSNLSVIITDIANVKFAKVCTIVDFITESTALKE